MRLRYRAALTACLLIVVYTGFSFAQSPASGEAPEPGALLERYEVKVSSTSTEHSSGVSFRLDDKFFGNGTAAARISLEDLSSSAELRQRPLGLRMAVERNVRDGEIVFALLVFAVQVQAFDADGNEVYRMDLPGFSFGDSKSGRWYERLYPLPTNVHRLEVSFFGNYE